MMYNLWDRNPVTVRGAIPAIAWQGLSPAGAAIRELLIANRIEAPYIRRGENDLHTNSSP